MAGGGIAQSRYAGGIKKPVPVETGTGFCQKAKIT